MDSLSSSSGQQQQQNSRAYQNVNDIKQRAYVKITEQPASKNFRFRYESEGRFTGSIPGTNSTSRIKTYPSIQVVGYVGKCYVVVSCVTKDYPHRPHPHYIVGKEGCKGGVCKLDIPPDTMSIQFSSIGIRCVKRKEIEESLRVRKLIKVDPFHTGFDPNKPSPIDLNVVRLCFQVIVETPTKNIALEPIVSDPIYNKKGQSDLTIVKMSDCTDYVDGGKDIIMLCEKVDKDDIEIRFFEENNGQTVWESFGDFHPSDVYKQVAISFRIPRYHRTDITEPVRVNVQLRRPSDRVVGESVPFEFLPVITKSLVSCKRRKTIDADSILRKMAFSQMNNIQNYEPPRQEVAGSTIPHPHLQPLLSPLNASLFPENLMYEEPPNMNQNPPNINPNYYTNQEDINQMLGFTPKWNLSPEIENKCFQNSPSHNQPQTWNIATPESNQGYQQELYNTWEAPPTTSAYMKNENQMTNVNANCNNLNGGRESVVGGGGCQTVDMEINNLSGSFSNFVLYDGDLAELMNTDDSLTRLVNHAAERLCQSSNVCA